MRVAFFGLACFTVGTFADFKFYRVQGLWGVQNAALHTNRVTLPTLAKVAVEAASACERNAPDDATCPKITSTIKSEMAPTKISGAENKHLP